MNESVISSEDNVEVSDPNQVDQLLNQAEQVNQQQKAKHQQVLGEHNAALTGYQRRQDVWTESRQFNADLNVGLNKELEEMDANHDKLVKAARDFLIYACSEKLKNGDKNNKFDRAINNAIDSAKLYALSKDKKKMEVIDFVAEGLVKGDVVKGVDDKHLKYVITAENIQPYIEQMKNNQVQRMRITNQASAQISKEADLAKKHLMARQAGVEILKLKKPSPVMQQLVKKAPDIPPNPQPPAKDEIKEIKISNIVPSTWGGINSFTLNFDGNEAKKFVFKDTAYANVNYKLQNTNGNLDATFPKDYVRITLTPESSKAINAFIKSNNKNKNNKEITIASEKLNEFKSKLKFTKIVGKEKQEECSLEQLLHASEITNGSLHVDQNKIKEKIPKAEIINAQYSNASASEVQANAVNPKLLDAANAKNQQQQPSVEDASLNQQLDAEGEEVKSENLDVIAASEEVKDVNQLASAKNPKLLNAKNQQLDASQQQTSVIDEESISEKTSVEVKSENLDVIAASEEVKNQQPIVIDEYASVASEEVGSDSYSDHFELIAEKTSVNQQLNESLENTDLKKFDEAIKEALARTMEKYPALYDEFNTEEEEVLYNTQFVCKVAEIANSTKYFTNGNPKMPLQDDKTSNDPVAKAMRTFSVEFQRACKSNNLFYTNREGYEQNTHGMRTKSIVSFLNQNLDAGQDPFDYIKDLIGEAEREKEKIDGTRQKLNFYPPPQLDNTSFLGNEDLKAPQVINMRNISRHKSMTDINKKYPIQHSAKLKHTFSRGEMLRPDTKPNVGRKK